MATSLARQLQSLQAPQTDTFLHQGRKKASLLFDPAEAANYDFKDIYGIGLAGLQELQLLPNGDTFTRLEPVLFSEVSQSVERSVRTEEVNKQLDVSIGEFLKALSPYLLLPPAQKALEWLLVRFHIHQYNIDAVMLAFLPYHETKIFVRMVQLLEFQFNKKWEWLTGIQKKGVVLTKKDLLKYLGREGWLQHFLCDEMSRRAENRPTERTELTEPTDLKSGNDVFCKFFASTLLALLYEAKEIGNAVVAVVAVCAGKCLMSEGREYRLTAYALVATLSQRVKLKEESSKAFALAIGEAVKKHGDVSGMKALALVLTAHTVPSPPTVSSPHTVSPPHTIPDRVFNLFTHPAFFNLAVRTINEGKLREFFWMTYMTAVELLFQKGNPSKESLVDFVNALTKKVHLEERVKERMVRYIVEKTLVVCQDVLDVDLPLARCLARMREVSVQTWSLLLNEQGGFKGHLLERLDLTFIQAADAVSLPSTNPTTSLYLRLNHPNTALRVAAAKELVCAMPTEDVSVEFLSDMVRDRMEDADPLVVVQLLTDPSSLRKVLSVESLKELMVRLLCRLEGKGGKGSGGGGDTWRHVEAAAVAVLVEVGEVEDYLPWFVGAVFRRNVMVVECLPQLVDLFPKCMAALKERVVLSEMLSDLVDDFVSRSGDAVFPAVKSLLSLLEQPDFPLSTALATLSLLVQVVNRLHLFFLSTDALLILDCVVMFLKRVTVTDGGGAGAGGVGGDEHLERSLQRVRKGRVSGVVVLAWCAVLWGDMMFDARTNPDALFRAAKFVLDDMTFVRDKFFQQGLVVVFVSCVLKDVRVTSALVTSVMKRGEVKSSFCRNVLWLCGEVLLLLKKELVEDGVVGEFLGVALPAMRRADGRMRKGGVRVLVNLRVRHNFASMEALELLDFILMGRDQIEMDEMAIVQVLANISSAGEKKKTRWLELLLQPVQSASELIRLNVLMALRQVEPLTVLLKLHPIIERLISTYDTLDSALDVRFLNECLERLGGSFPLSVQGVGVQGVEGVQGVVVRVMLEALSLPGRLNVEAPAEVVLRQMFFLGPAKLGEDVHNRILQEVLRVYIEKVNPSAQTAFRKYLKHVRIPGRLLIAQLNDQSVSPSLSRGVSQGVGQTGKRLSAPGLAKLNNPKRQTKEFWKRLASLLELVQAKKKVSDVSLFVKELFDVAKETVVLEGGVGGVGELVEELENVRRLIFSTINFHCRRAQAEAKGDVQDKDSALLDPSVIDVSAVVECIRSSTDSQTHLSALVLLSTLATVMPANVMQNCMTIFTLTGSKLLHKDDAYSVEVVGRTIDVLLPVMLKADPQRRLDTVRSVVELFVDALPHMAVHRRQFLFRRVLRGGGGDGVGGGEEWLWILVVLLMNVYVVKGLSVEEEDEVKRRSYPVLCEFLEQLFEGIPVEAQVRNLQQATEYILSVSSPSVKSAGSPLKKRKTITASFEKPLVNVNFTSEEQIRLITAMVTFIAYQIPSHSFHARGSVEGRESVELDRFLEGLLFSLLDVQSRARTQSRVGSLSSVKAADRLGSLGPVKAGEVAAWAELLKRSSVAVTEILGQMSWLSFVKIMMGVLRDAESGVLKTALEELGGTLSLRAAVTRDDVPRLVPLIGALVDILKRPAELTAEGAGVQRGCLFCLRQLAGILGAYSSDTWVTIMTTSVEFLDSSDLTIRCEAIGCVTAVIATVRTAVLPRLHDFLPVLLENIHQILSERSQETVALLTAVDALEVVVSCLTAFVSPQLPKILAVVAMCKGKSVKAGVKEVFGGKVLKVRSVLCMEVPFRVMFTAFKETYGVMKQAEVFAIFNDSLKKAKTGDVLAMQREIVEFLFTVFEGREDLPLALDALSLVALRMPESSFKGLFMKVYLWATQGGVGGGGERVGGGDKRRVLTFYQIVERLTDALKHLFVIYAANVVSHAVQIMTLFHVEKRGGGVREDDREIETDILVTIFDVLMKFFKYDSAGYFNADQCDLLNQPLIDQLDNYREPLSYRRLTEHLIPAITAFAVCLNDDSLWKPLHYQVLLKTRHDESTVRVAALKAVEALVESMGEAYGSLLSEAVTFLVELSAEDDEVVEVQCARTKATIERVLGDSNIWKNEID